MAEEKKINLENNSEKEANPSASQYSLNDDRRVKVLSPGALVAKRFFRNRVAMVGLIILIFMFAFSFIGGLISPYSEDQLFYRIDTQQKEYAAAIENTEFRYAAKTDAFTKAVQAQALLAIKNGKTEFTYKKTGYKLTEEGADFYSVTQGKKPIVIGICYKDVITTSSKDAELSFDFQYAALKAYSNDESDFTADGQDYTMDDDNVVYLGTEEIAYISRYVVQALMSDVFLSREFKETVVAAIEDEAASISFAEEGEEEKEYLFKYDPSTKKYTITQETETRVYDTYASPSWEHPLGTDRNGMDMMTRLMYGGRISLVIGFIVEAISILIGVTLGGLAGYFGKWVDNLVMRIVDIFYCIPSMPIIIILGAAMDAIGVDPQIRMIYLMLILGFLGWPGYARLVRGQILSLREQEFMTAAEATGLSVKRRIFKHLVPNVIPQLIVSCSMGWGSTIITEATLSFLGLGVKFPFASWGNIINDVNNTYVLTSYWFIWIPAGVLLLASVLAFNLVGDGLRDAFDPRMKR